MATEPTLVGVDRTPEAAAAHGLYERHSRRVYGFCLQQLGTREEAEDATQGTFLNAFRALRRGISPVAEAAWLLSIAQNVCRTRRRSSLRRRRVEAPRDLQGLQDTVPAPPRGGSDELLRLEEALIELPEAQRRAILLREWQGLSYREIAQELGLSQAAIETLIFRARRSLAARLEEAPRRTRSRRIVPWADLGSAASWLQGLLAGGAAKAAATAAAVTAVALTGGAPLRHDAPPAAEAAPPAARPAPAPRAFAPRPAPSLLLAAPARERSRSRAAPRLLTSRRTAPRPPTHRRTAPRLLPPEPAPSSPAATPESQPTPDRAPSAGRAVRRSEEQAARRSAREERKAVAAEIRADRREQQDKPPQGRAEATADGRGKEKPVAPEDGAASAPASADRKERDR